MIDDEGKNGVKMPPGIIFPCKGDLNFWTQTPLNNSQKLTKHNKCVRSSRTLYKTKERGSVTLLY